MLKGRSRRPDPVEIALQHGRHREPPVRKAENDAVGLPQLPNQMRHLVLGVGRLTIASALRLGHNGRKALPVKIGSYDLMPVLQLIYDDPEQGVVIAVRQRMAM